MASHPARIPAALLCALALSGCAVFGKDAKPKDAGEELIVHVAGQRVPCGADVPELCLQVRFQPGAAWQPHYGDIAGFDWQVGVEYVIRVRESAVEGAPADAGSRRWVLEEILQRSR